MYEREKSDPAIVPMKPTNNTRRLAAELVEPRAGAEGNASQQSTRRAQDRESVSQALERVRQVARQRRTERFTALFHHLSIPMPSDGILSPQARRGVRGRWAEMAGLRDGPRSPESRTCTLGSIGERIGRNRHDVGISRNRTDASAL